MGKFISLVGSKMGTLTVIKRVENIIEWDKKYNRNQIYVQYLCQCDCGKEIIRRSSTLKQNIKTSCGNRICAKRFTDFTGQKFTRLLIIKHQGFDKNGTTTWVCRCDCGKDKIIASDCFSSGKTRSCGCLQKELSSKNSKGRIPSNKLESQKSNFNGIFDRYKRNASYRNLNFLLSEEEFKNLTSNNCHYCGIEPKQKMHTAGKKVQNGYYLYNGIDRKDNTKGYILENCLTCCSECNYSKKNKSYEQFTEHAKRIVINLKLMD